MQPSSHTLWSILDVTHVKSGANPPQDFRLREPNLDAAGGWRLTPFGCGLAVQRTAHLELRTACRFWRKRCCAPGIWCQGHLWLKSGAATQFITCIYIYIYVYIYICVCVCDMCIYIYIMYIVYRKIFPVFEGLMTVSISCMV